MKAIKGFLDEDEYQMKAMNEELSQIEKNKTWELVPRTLNKNVIGAKWVFRNKMDEAGKITRKFQPDHC